MNNVSTKPEYYHSKKSPTNGGRHFQQFFQWSEIYEINHILNWNTFHIFHFKSFPPSVILPTHNGLLRLQLAWLAQSIEYCVRSSQRSGFHSRSSLNFYGFFFNRLGCLCNCKDHSNLRSCRDSRLSAVFFFCSGGTRLFLFFRKIDRIERFPVLAAIFVSNVPRGRLRGL